VTQKVTGIGSNWCGGKKDQVHSKTTKSMKSENLLFMFTSENTIELILISRTMVDVRLNTLSFNENRLGIQDLR
jgi:hypothetical protein